jgi:preprotein translocase subunit SecA
MTTLPSTTWRMLAQRRSGQELPRGLDAAWDRAGGVIQRLIPRRKNFLARAQLVVDLEKELAGRADAKLREQAMAMRDLFRRGRQTPGDLIRAFALVREVATRQLGERPYLVQVAGAMAIHAGCVAEMATGEGKTLTATLPATIAGWGGRGCHVVTTNDYLAKRDAEWMRPVYEFCGLKVAYIEQAMPPEHRRAAYLADVTYCTNKEVTADFLRDRLALGRLTGLPSAVLARIVEGSGSGTDRVVQRGLHQAIVDEGDSILIDEAVTPLIISGEAPNSEQVAAFQQAMQLAQQLAPGEHFRTNSQFREVELNSAGKAHLAELAAPLGGLWQGSRRREELVVQALTAMAFYLRDKQYVVQDGKVVIVDDFTGRLMPDREWREGLHQAVQAKEQLEIQPPKDTWARISFQRFFRLYRRLSGMTGTAWEGWPEFYHIYRMPVVVIPTHRPVRREMLPDAVFADEQTKWAAVVEEIARMHATDRPVLVGTRSVRASETLSQMLQQRGLDNQVLNAVRLAEEAQTVAGAGQAGRITVATNMAGRGTDIKLGRGVAEMGGLFVLATERHESGRVDRQLFGRCARQGDPGTARAFVSLEDDLVVRFGGMLGKLVRRRCAGRTADLGSTLTQQLFSHAQRHAERMALRQRKGVLRADDWLDEYLGFAGAER